MTALGVYELELNGQRVGDHVLAPGWTSYHHRLRYQTFDVTALLRTGDNAIGARLADGWYRGRLGWRGGVRAIYGDRSRCWPSSRSPTPTGHRRRSSPTRTGGTAGPD